MKIIINYFAFIFLFLLVQTAQSQTYEFHTLLEDGNYLATVKITIQDVTARISKNYIKNSDTIDYPSLYNLSSIQFDGNKFDVPDNGKNYWYIPFNNDKPWLLKPIPHESSCDNVYNCTQGSCGFQSDGSCRCGSGSSNPCVMTVCEPRYCRSGPAIILEVDKIEEKFVFTGPYIDNNNQNKLCQISILVKDSTAYIHKVLLDYIDGIYFNVFNLTQYPLRQEGKFLYLSEVPENAHVKFIPFNIDETFNDWIVINEYSECCGTCGYLGECNWLPAGPNCTACKCRDNVCLW